MNLDAESEAKRQRRILLGIVGFIVAVLTTMSLMGRYGFIWKTVIVPVLFLAALASRRGTQFLRDWALFLSLVVLFDYVRGLIFALITHFELPVYMNYAIDLELVVGGGKIYPAILQDLVGGLPIADVLDRFLVVVHSSHFLAFLFFGLIVWLLRPDGFNRYRLAMLTLMYTGAVFYFLIPTVPPWMAADRFGVVPPIEHISAAIYNTSVPTLQRALDINPIAAMPSLHAAFPTLCCFIAIRHFRQRAWPMFLYALLVFTAIIYLGEHYLVDVIAGWLLSAALYGFIYKYLPTRADGKNGWARVERWLRGPVSPESQSLSRVLAPAMAIVFVSTLVGAVTAGIVRPSFEPTPDFVSRELASVNQVAVSALEDYAYARSQFKSEIAEADLLIRSEDLQKGLSLLERLVTGNPEDPEPLYWLTYFEYRTGKIEESQVQETARSLESFSDERSELFEKLLLSSVDIDAAAVRAPDVPIGKRSDEQPSTPDG